MVAEMALQISWVPSRVCKNSIYEMPKMYLNPFDG